MFVYVFVLEILIFFVLGWICSFSFVGYKFYLFNIDGGDLYWFLILLMLFFVFVVMLYMVM